MELSIYKMKMVCEQKGTFPKCENPTLIANLLYSIFDPIDIMIQESFYILCLNRQLKVITSYLISKGGLAATVVDPKIVFQKALMTPGCSSIILSHNHPSGYMEPSKEDRVVTQTIVQGAKILDLKVNDHIIIGRSIEDGFYSFANEGLIL